MGKEVRKVEYSDLEYNPVDWKDYPSTATKLNAKNLSNPEKGIVKIIKAIMEIRDLLGHEDLKTGNIITTVNEINEKFGGYIGYNMFDVNDLEETTNGFVLRKSLEDIGVKPGKTYSISMEGTFDIYVYELDSNSATLALHTLTEDDSTDTFTINSNCTNLTILFAKGQGYLSFDYCKAAKFMLEYGTQHHPYEPYTGGKEMTDLWEEILENRTAINSFMKAIGGEY